MKKFIILFAIASILSCVFTYIVFTQEGSDPGLNFPPSGASPQAQIDFYVNEIKKCQEYIDELSLGINAAEILFNYSKENFPGPFSGYGYSDRINRFNLETRYICNRIENIYKPRINDIAAKLPPTPTPTPTPSASPAPTPTKPKESNDELKKKQIDGYNEEIKFIKDHRKKLKEIKTGADKVFMEIDDLFKKTFPNKPIPKFTAGTASTGGLSTTTFDTPFGRITFNLPDGIQAGDTISGTVFIESKKQTGDEIGMRETNFEEFEIDVISRPQFIRESPEVDTATSQPEVGSLLADSIWKLPLKGMKPNEMSTFDLADERLISALISRNCGVVLSVNDGQKSIPIELVKLSLTSVGPIAVSYPKQPGSPWESPNYVQSGGQIPIIGPFDGNANNTSLELDGKPLTVLAESPRGAFFHLPAETVGTHEVVIRELGKEARIPYRLLGVGLSSPKTNLTRGEKTTVTIEVTGLEGLMENEMIPLELVSSGVINMDGGDSQSLRIRKKDVNNGVFRTTREVTGHSTGGWGVTATVIDPRQKPVFVPLIRDSKGNGFRQKPGSNGTSFFDFVNVRDPRTGERLEGEHKLDTACKTSLASLPILSLRFKNGNSKHSDNRCLIFITPRIIIRD